MGAAHEHDLTEDVTHLVVGKLETAKYIYVAKERPDVKAVTAKWLEAVRDAWLEAEEVDVSALEQEHSAPTFSDLTICVSGFTDRKPSKAPGPAQADF